MLMTMQRCKLQTTRARLAEACKQQKQKDCLRCQSSFLQIQSGQMNKPSGTLTGAIPIVGMPYLIRRNPHNFHFPRFPHISPSAHLFPPGTHLFFRFIMKLAGSPDSQPKRLSETHFPTIQPETQLLYFSNISPNCVANPKISVALFCQQHPTTGPGIFGTPLEL